MFEPVNLGHEISGGINRVYLDPRYFDPENEFDLIDMVFFNGDINFDAFEKAVTEKNYVIQEDEGSYFVTLDPNIHEPDLCDPFLTEMRILKGDNGTLVMHQFDDITSIMDRYLDLIK